MAPEASIHGDSNDTSAFLQDLKHRYRYLHEPRVTTQRPLGQRGGDFKRRSFTQRVLAGIRGCNVSRSICSGSSSEWRTLTS